MPATDRLPTGISLGESASNLRGSYECIIVAAPDVRSLQLAQTLRLLWRLSLLRGANGSLSRRWVLQLLVTLWFTFIEKFFTHAYIASAPVTVCSLQAML